MFSGLPTFDVDFHEAEDGVALFVGLTDLVEGQRWSGFRKSDVVQLWDPESGYCLGRVERVRAGRIAVRPMWDSWSPVPAVEISFSFAFQPVPQVDCWSYDLGVRLAATG